MLNFIGGGIGVILGFWLALRRGGNRLDLLHYGAIFGIIGFVLGVFAMLVVPVPA